MSKTKGRSVPKRKKLFIIADAAVDTGFATVTHNIVNELHTRWDISILGINYYGDPHPIQKKAEVWSPSAIIQGDVYGLSRVKTLLGNIEPDVVLVINDPWIASEYARPFMGTPGVKILYAPIDASNIKPMYTQAINGSFDHVIGYTQYGVDQLKHAGLTVPTSVIPHGVDTQLFYPLDQKEVRLMAELDPDWFIVQVVDRNQIRKRIDLALHYFAQWVHMTDKPDTVKFYYHGALVDEGWDIAQLAQELGIHDRLIISHKNLNPAHGFPLDAMKLMYNVADIKLSTTLGEGWGLTTMESMACKIANIVPNSAALGEWAKGGVLYTDINPIPQYNIKGLNTRGSIPDMASTIKNLEKLYKNSDDRKNIAQAGYNLVHSSQFTWKSVANRFDSVFNEAKAINRDVSDE